MKPTRPVLRYHGGKWRLAPWIVSHFPPHTKYLRVTPFSRVEFEDSYESDPDPVIRAHRIIVRSFMGHGSASYNPDHLTGFRWKAWRQGVALPLDWGRYPAALKAVVARLRRVVIDNRDAMEVLFGWDDSDTLHYVDPPYPHSTRHKRAPSNRPYRFEMSDADHTQLAECLRSLRGMVVLSGYRCDLYDTLFSDWVRVDRSTMGSGQVASVSRTESLWLNPAVSSSINQQSLF